MKPVQIFQGFHIFSMPMIFIPHKILSSLLLLKQKYRTHFLVKTEINNVYEFFCKGVQKIMNMNYSAYGCNKQCI